MEKNLLRLLRAYFLPESNTQAGARNLEFGRINRKFGRIKRKKACSRLVLSLASVGMLELPGTACHPRGSQPDGTDSTRSWSGWPAQEGCKCKWILFTTNSYILVQTCSLWYKLVFSSKNVIFRWSFGYFPIQMRGYFPVQLCTFLYKSTFCCNKVYFHVHILNIQVLVLD